MVAIDRSATPRVSQQSATDAAAAASPPPSDDTAGGPSVSPPGPGLFGWMKNAFQPFGPQGVLSGSPSSPTSSGSGGLLGGKRLRSSSANGTSSPGGTGEVIQAPVIGSSAIPVGQEAQHSEAVREYMNGGRGSRLSMSSLGDNTSSSDEEEDADEDDDDESGAEEVYAPFQSRHAPVVAQASPLIVVKPTARREVNYTGSSADELPEKPVLLERPNGGTASHRQSLTMDQDQLEGQHVQDDGTSAVTSSTPSLVLTPPQSNAAKVSPPIEGDGSRDLDGLPYPNAAAPSREHVVLGSRQANIRAARKAKGGHGRGQSESAIMARSSSGTDDESGGTSQEWDDSRSKTPLASAAAWARQQASQTPKPDRVEEEEEIPDLPPTKPNVGHSRRAASEATGSTFDVSPIQPLPKRAARRNIFGRKDRPSTSGGEMSNSEEDAVEELDGRSTPSDQKKSGSFWNFGRSASVSRSSSMRPSSSRTPRPGDHHRLDSSISSVSSAADSDLSEAGVSDGRRLSNASLGSATSGRSKGDSGPKPIKTRAKNKTSKERNFQRLFLMQELQLGENVSGTTSPIASGRGSVTSNSRPNSALINGTDSFAEVGKSGSTSPERPGLTRAPSSASLRSAVSSSAPSVIQSVSSAGQSATSATTSRKRATWAMKFSVDGKYLAVAGQDAVIRVFEVLSNPLARKVEVESAPLVSAASSVSSQSGSSICNSATTGSTGKASKKLPSVPPFESLVPIFASRPVREYRGHTLDVLDLSWSKNNFLLSSSMDKTARLWHISKDECLCTFGHLDFVTSACFHPRDDRFFLSGSLDGRLRLWNISRKVVQASTEVPGLITACAFTASGRTACVGTFAGAALFYETERLQYTTSIAVRSSQGKNARGRKITGIEAVPMGEGGSSGGGGGIGTHPAERVLITSNDSRVRVYDLRDKSLAAKYKASGYVNRTSQIRASLSTDGAYVVAGSEDAGVYVWDVRKDGPNESKKGRKKAAGTGDVPKAGPAADGAYEYWTAATGTVTCALMAPLKTHAFLASSEDPLHVHASTKAVHANVGHSSTTNALSALSLASALSAAMPGPLRPGAQSMGPGSAYDPSINRIICSVDDSAIVRVWRADTYHAL